MFLRLKNYTILGVTNRKLILPRVGPFLVKRVISSELAYEIDLLRN